MRVAVQTTEFGENIQKVNFRLAAIQIYEKV
jgi:hypothetical protein